MFKALLDPAEPKAGRANFRLGSFTTISVFMFWLFCPLWVNRALAIQRPGRPLSVVAPISDKMVRRGERSEVPQADIQPSFTKLYTLGGHSGPLLSPRAIWTIR
jgi:hypothetical protein